MKARRLFDGEALPLLMEPDGRDEAPVPCLVEWVEAERATFGKYLQLHGGVLLRGFNLETVADFERVCRAFAPQLKDYVGGESPRTAVSGGIYTSTEYPAHLEIALHGEMSYAHEWPACLFFFSLQPADTGGETPIADSRRILASIDADVLRRFEQRQIMYLNNYHGGWGLGKSWQDTFETTDRAALESHLESAGISFRWSDNGLWTRAVRPAVVAHPGSGERVWFNQADRWHVSSRGEENARKLLRIMSEDELPRHARYGDGSPIEARDLASVRAAYQANRQSFQWHRGDLLVLDNLLTAHGRGPFTGERRVLVAMA